MRRDIPIMYSAPMVRGLLREVERPGTGKTETRRGAHAWLYHTDLQGRRHGFNAATYEQAVKGREGLRKIDMAPGRTSWTWTADGIWSEARTLWCAFPRVQPGDRLWVREAFMPRPGLEEIGRPHYRADKDPTEWRRLWKPSIHMPRRFSRLTLEVTDVTLEPLQDITEAAAGREGIVGFDNGDTHLYGVPCEGGYELSGMTRRESFMNLWCHLHGPAAWVANPDVFAITFKVHACNIDKMKEAA